MLARLSLLSVALTSSRFVLTEPHSRCGLPLATYSILISACHQLTPFPKAPRAGNRTPSPSRNAVPSKANNRSPSPARETAANSDKADAKGGKSSDAKAGESQYHG